VTYLEPMEGNAPATGFDLVSEPNRRDAVDRSVASKGVVATSPIRLVQETGEQSGILLVSAVPGGQNGAGILLVVLRMGIFMEALLEPTGRSINVELIDVGADRPLFDTLSGSGATALNQQTFVFGARHYAIRAAPSQLYISRHRSWQSLAVLMAGVLSTSLLGALLLLGTGERHRFATLLAERTRERDRIWQVSEDLLGVGNFAGYFFSTNPAWTRLLGWTDDEIRTMHVSELRHPDDAEAANEGRKRLAEGAGTVRMENRFRHKDGSYRWIYWTLTEEQGSIYVIGRNVTADKERAQSLSQAEEQLRQLQKMESVGQLTGGIAHDFNNLLQAVLGNLDMAQRRIGDEPALRFLASASRAAVRGARLVGQLLAFSRRQHLQPRAVDVNKLLGGMGDMLHRSIGATIRIDEVLAPDLWPAMADPNQIESVILNLAINGRDAMPSGGRLLIETRNSRRDDRERPTDLAAGDYVCIAVSDTGTGMSEEVMARALEPFFTTKEPGKGSGLGLSMVHGVAKQSGGGVALSSRVGLGTTVRVYVPRAQSAAVAPDESRATEAADWNLLKGKLVLLIDDDPDVRQVAATQLEELGCKVLTAESGSSGLVVLDGESGIDIVVVDFAMPSMNGIEVAEKIAARRPTLPIVIITGYADVDLTADRGRKIHVLKKPFQRADLAATLSAVARSSRVGAGNLLH
jgi:PAS domain S-box-containing protein